MVGGRGWCVLGGRCGVVGGSWWVGGGWVVNRVRRAGSVTSGWRQTAAGPGSFDRCDGNLLLTKP